MKVRMTQTVEVDGIPDTILKMLRELSSQMEEATRLSYEATTAAEINYNSAIKHKLVMEMVNNAKEQFETANESLADVVSVLGSYIQILEPRTQPLPDEKQLIEQQLQETLSQLEQRGPESGPDTEPPLSNLEDK